MTSRPESDFREKYFGDVIARIESEEFVNRHRVDNKSGQFTRKRKLTFIHLIVLITQGLTRAIQRELNSFYQKLQGSDFSIQEVTKGAFTHARAKLKAEAFVELNSVGNESFYKNAPYLTWNDFRLLAIDGSTLILPNHPSIEQEFGKTYFGPNADSPRSAARISMLYDVLNYTTLDAQIGSYDTSERELAKKHLPLIKSGEDLIIMDRGYAGFPMFYDLQQKGIDYCIRMREDWWKEEIGAMKETGEVDKIITVKGPQLFEMWPMKLFHEELTCRVVIVELPTGGIEILVTSLLDQEKYKYETFVKLYGTRWAIEEGFKFYKSRLQLEAFSGKTALAVKQDFYAKVFMMTTMAVAAFPIEEKLKKEQETSTRQHSYKVNRTNALGAMKESFGNIFIGKMISSALHALDKILKATVELVRPNRKNPRKKSQKKPPSMNYKQL